MLIQSEISKTFFDFVEIAAQLASDFRDPTLQHQVVALWAKDRVLGYGVNQRRHAKAMSYFYDSLHAEADLIRRFGDRLKGAKVFLYRFNNAPDSPFAGEPLCAKPCLLCSHLLNEIGINKVVYVKDDGLVESIKGSDLSQLKENPVVLTKMFLDRSGKEHHGKFYAQEYLIGV